MIDQIILINEIENYYHLKQGVLLKRTRIKTVAHARIVAMYIMRKLYNYSFMEIGDYFNRDHSTVVKNCKKVVNYLNNNKEHQLSKDIIMFIKKFKEESYNDI